MAEPRFPVACGPGRPGEAVNSNPPGPRPPGGAVDPSPALIRASSTGPWDSSAQE